MEEIKTAITIVVTMSSFLGALIAIEKYTKGALTKWLLSSVLNKLDSLDERVDVLEINDLKQIIMNDNIPLAERVIAGERYLKLGGNGEIHAHYDVLVEQYKKELKERK